MTKREGPHERQDREPRRRGVVARILVDAQLLREEDLRYAERIHAKLATPKPLLEVLESPGGLVLIAGTFGSGKTTTLHSCLDHLSGTETSLVSIEQTEACLVEGISLCTHGGEDDPTLEESLSHAMAQNIDVLSIGEIGDVATAQAAIAAALSGRKVLSTLQARDGVSAIARLIAMGVQPSLVSSSLCGVLTQGLLRHVCETCSVEYEVTPGDLRRLGCDKSNFEEAHPMLGHGCSDCGHTGYRGRVAACELLVLNERVREAIRLQVNPDELRQVARASTSFVTVHESGLVKAADGLTSVPEVIRVLPRVGKPRPMAELRRLLGA